jgi:hypothetical protein
MKHGQRSDDRGCRVILLNAMHLIVQNETASDFVVGTGQSHSIAEFCEAAFGVVGLDWTKYIKIDESLVRKVDNRYTRADFTKLRFHEASVRAWLAPKGSLFRAGYDDGAGKNADFRVGVAAGPTFSSRAAFLITDKKIEKR